MTVMSSYRHVDFKCAYEPCGHECTKAFNRNDPLGSNNEFSTFFCPKCGLYTLKRKPLDLGVHWSKGGLTGLLYIGTPHPKMPGWIIWKALTPPCHF